MSTVSEKAPFLTTVGIVFGPLFETQKQTQKNLHKCSMLRLRSQNDPQSDPRGSPKGGQNPSTIVAKSSLSRRGRPPATFDLKKCSRMGGTPTKYTQHRLNNYIILPKFGQSMDTRSDSKTKKWRAFRPVFLAFGRTFQQAEYRPPRPQKYCCDLELHTWKLGSYNTSRTSHTRTIMQSEFIFQIYEFLILNSEFIILNSELRIQTSEL